jgi:hypothetical protein
MEFREVTHTMATKNGWFSGAMMQITLHFKITKVSFPVFHRFFIMQADNGFVSSFGGDFALDMERSEGFRLLKMGC